MPSSLSLSLSSSSAHRLLIRTTTMNSSSVFKIIPGIQSYDWGKVGKLSKAAAFAEVSIPGFQVEDKPYAEVGS